MTAEKFSAYKAENDEWPDLNPKWFDRDRFVLSNGHGSMLLYSLLHLTGYKISIDDIKDFRQSHSKTPGHPEYDIDIGGETITNFVNSAFTFLIVYKF